MMQRLANTALLSLVLAAAGCAAATSAGGGGGGFTLTSPAFTDGAPIPLEHSAYGRNVSPVLEWSGAPEGTRSYALVLVDPDVPMPDGFVHWVVYNIPASASGLPEQVPMMPTLTEPAGAVQGLNGIRRTGYFGPRPPAGAPHHYQFRLYALSSEPDLAEGLGRDELMAAIRPTVLAETVLVGTYQGE